MKCMKFYENKKKTRFYINYMFDFTEAAGNKRQKSSPIRYGHVRFISEYRNTRTDWH